MTIEVYVMAVDRQLIHGPAPMDIWSAFWFLRDVATGEADLAEMYCPDRAPRNIEGLLRIAGGLMVRAWEDAVRAGAVNVLPCSPNALRVRRA